MKKNPGAVTLYTVAMRPKLVFMASTNKIPRITRGVISHLSFYPLLFFSLSLSYRLIRDYSRRVEPGPGGFFESDVFSVSSRMINRARVVGPTRNTRGNLEIAFVEILPLLYFFPYHAGSSILVKLIFFKRPSDCYFGCLNFITFFFRAPRANQGFTGFEGSTSGFLLALHNNC